MSGVILLAITIGSAADMVQNAKRHNIELQMKCDYAKSYLKQNNIELRKDWTPDPPFYLTNHADERTASKSNNLSKSLNNNFTPSCHVQN